VVRCLDPEELYFGPAAARCFDQGAGNFGPAARYFAPVAFDFGPAGSCFAPAACHFEWGEANS